MCCTTELAGLGAGGFESVHVAFEEPDLPADAVLIAVPERPAAQASQMAWLGRSGT